MENIKDNAGNTLTIYENRIDEELHNFYFRFIPDDMKQDPAKVEQYIRDSSQNLFNAALIHIGNTVFKDKNSLKLIPYTVTPGTTYRTNNNKYNYFMLMELLEVLKYYCSIYDKRISIHNYCYMVHIDPEYLMNNSIKNINNNINSVNDSGFNVTYNGIELYKRLKQASENSLSDILVSGKRNPVGILGILNHEFQWNVQQTAETPQKAVITANELQALGNLHKDTQAIEQHDTP